MNCELCDAPIANGEFGDVDGAIVCPRCLGHVPGVPMDSTVAEFYERNGDEIIYDPEESFVQDFDRGDGNFTDAVL